MTNEEIEEQLLDECIRWFNRSYEDLTTRQCFEFAIDKAFSAGLEEGKKQYQIQGQEEAVILFGKRHYNQACEDIKKYFKESIDISFRSGLIITIINKLQEEKQKR
jgi:hypothetical protein